MASMAVMLTVDQSQGSPLNQHPPFDPHSQWQAASPPVRPGSVWSHFWNAKLHRALCSSAVWMQRQKVGDPSPWPQYDNDSDIKQSLAGLNSPHTPSRELGCLSLEGLKPLLEPAMSSRCLMLPAPDSGWALGPLPLPWAPLRFTPVPCCTAGCTQS